jgi:uncharacterized repeat protein (TIGR01451 family)
MNRFFAAPFAVLLAVFAMQGVARAGTPGIDGAKTISAANTVVNGYSALTQATAGSTTITVANISALSPSGLTPLEAGSVVMLYQANGATIDDTDTATYGNVTNYNNAGYYEFTTVGSVSGSTITINSSCGPLAHTYTTSGGSEAEIIRVPQYTNLTINSGASITATPWSSTEVTTEGSASYGSTLSTGAYGGIVAVDVAGTTTINGSINVTGAGFLGGDGYQNGGYSAPQAAGTAHYHAQPITDTVFTGETGGGLLTALGGMKGESIAGNQANYDNNFVSRYGRGAPGNGGGGANGHNNGGGGGANGNNGNTWYGVGLLDTGYTAYYSNSNGKNPLGTYDNGGFSANGTALAGTPMSVDSGGGRGGYSFADPPNIVPTNEGGLGGRPLTATANSRIFFGGGGGAGDENDSYGGYGGNGGGIVIINTATLAGSGSIVANGSPGGVPLSSDGAGGGGGGGSVVVLTNSGSVATINANGGAGGNMANGGASDDEGTGGGGGGGFVAAPATTITVAGGGEGLIDAQSPAYTAGFPPYGATLGTAGLSTTAPTSFTYCYTPILGVAKAASVPVALGNGSYSVTYTVLFENYGDTPLKTVGAQDALSTTFPSPVTYTVTSLPTVTSTTNGATATATAGYNGNSQNYLVQNATLPVSNPASAATTSTFTIVFTVQISGVPSGSQTYSNEVTSGAFGVTGNANNVEVLDGSDNGTNPDPSGSFNPNTAAENVPTPITVFGPIPFTKTVQNITTGEATGLTTDTAVPGNILKYTLSFTNNTGGFLTGYSIKDVIPTNTTYYATTPAACTTVPAGLTCTATYTPPVGTTAGFVTFTVSGTANGQTSPGIPSTTTTSPAQLIFTFEVTVN